MVDIRFFRLFAILKGCIVEVGFLSIPKVSSNVVTIFSSLNINDLPHISTPRGDELGKESGVM